MRIKEALKIYNDNRGKKPKITQAMLGNILMPQRPVLKSEQLVSRWCSGFEYNQLKASHIVKMTKLLGVDADFLMRDIDLESHDLDFSTNALLSIMKYAGLTPNKILLIKKNGDKK